MAVATAATVPVAVAVATAVSVTVAACSSFGSLGWRRREQWGEHRFEHGKRRRRDVGVIDPPGHGVEQVGGALAYRITMVDVDELVDDLCRVLSCVVRGVRL